MDIQKLTGFLQKSLFEFELGYRNLIMVPNCPLHSHESFELVYHVKGRGMVGLSGGKSVPFEEKSVAIHPPRIRHRQKTSAPGEDVCLYFSGPKELDAVFDEFFAIPRLDDAWLVGAIFNLADSPSPISPLEKAAFNHTVSVIVAKIAGRQTSNHGGTGTPHPDYPSAAFSHLRENMHSITNLAHVAESLDISYDHLRHLYLKRYGRTMKEELSSMRIDKAKQLLAQTPLPLKAIARQCGYSSDRYFCMAFKSETGMTPGNFKNATR
jgi:AraC-like DNA-binding protein